MARHLTAANSEYGELSVPILSSYPIAVTALVNLDALSGDQCVFSIGDVGSALHRLSLWVKSSGQVVVHQVRENGGAGNATTSVGIGAGVWHHVGGYWAADNNRAALVDGANKVVNQASAGFPDLTRTRVGALADSGAGMLFTGALGYVAVLRAVPSDREWAALGDFVHPEAVRPGDLVAIWELTDDWFDQYGNTLTPINGGGTVVNDPDQIHGFPTRPSIIYIPQTAAALAGNATGNVGASGDLTTDIPVVGASLIVAGAAGALSSGIPIEGAAVQVSLAGGVLNAQIKFQGSSLGQALAAAGIDTAVLFQGAASQVAAATGDLTAPGSGLEGHAAGQASAPADLTIQIILNGAALQEVLANANLTAPGSGLAGAAGGSAQAGADLSTGIDLAGSPNAAVTGQGILSTIIQTQGAAAQIATTTGGLSAQIRFDAAALINALAGGDLTAGSGLSGAALVEALSSAQLTTNIPFNAAALVQASASGLLTDYWPVGHLRFKTGVRSALGFSTRLN